MDLSNKKSVEIELAFLHQSICVPGWIGSEKTLSVAKIKGLESMQWTPLGLILEGKGKIAIVPHANVVSAVVKQEQ